MKTFSINEQNKEPIRIAFPDGLENVETNASGNTTVTTKNGSKLVIIVREDHVEIRPLDYLMHVEDRKYELR